MIADLLLMRSRHRERITNFAAGHGVNPDSCLIVTVPRRPA